MKIISRNKDLFSNVPKLYSDQLVFIQTWLASRQKRVCEAKEHYAEELATSDGNSRYAVASRGTNRRFFSNSTTIEKEGIFGVVEIMDESESTRQYGLGSSDIPHADIIAAWHPAAKIFYEGDFGEYFAITLGKKTLEVELSAKVQMIQKSWVFKRGTGQYEYDKFDLILEPQDNADIPREEDDQGGLLDVRALLTKEQYRQIATAHRKPLIIQGKAGSGKTTVGLYRLSFLAYHNPKEGIEGIDPKKLLIITYNIALNNYVKSHLTDIGLDGAALYPFHNWAAQVLERAYNGKIQKLPDSVVKRIKGFGDSKVLKDQLAVLAMIEDHVAHQDKVLPEWLRERWTKKGIPTKAITECLAWYCAHDAPFLRKIIHVRTKLLSKRNNIRVLFSKEEDARSKRTLKQDLEVYEYLYVHLKDVYGKMSNYKRDMRRIFCNMSLLKKHMPDWSEERLKNVITFNDLLIRRSAGAKMNVGPCVGYDDIPILIRIIQVKNGGLVDYETNNVYHYDHIFVDEAQDFGAVALKVLMSTVRSRTGVTIVGDKNQKIFHSSKFVAWSSIAKELGIPESEVNNLTVSHRSQHEITRFCDWVLGDEFVDNNPIRDEYMPTFIQSRDVEGLYETLFSTVMQRYIEHPNKHHVVICNWPQEAQSIMERAQKYFAAYDVEAPLRRGYKETFVFSSGITFTNRQQIKGLEFDSVFVFEPNIEQFSDNEQGRCSFYTVISRPREHLSFFGVNEPCSLLVQAIEEGMVMDLSSHSFVLDDEDLDMDF